MAITTAMCTFKKELLEAVHNFKNSGGSTFNLALYTSSASLGAGTTAYTTSNEVSGTNYTAKGAALTRVDPSSSGTTALTDLQTQRSQMRRLLFVVRLSLTIAPQVIPLFVRWTSVVLRPQQQVTSPFSFLLRMRQRYYPNAQS